jgi:hypothetical protein
MPFAEYKDFADCVKKTMARKKDWKKERASGYCAIIHKKITGKYPSELSKEAVETLEKHSKIEKEKHKPELGKRFTLSIHQLGSEKHFDLYLEKDGFVDNYAFEPIKVGEKTVLAMNSKLRRKGEMPLSLLEMEGTIPKGQVGASRNFPGVIKILERGTYKILKEEGDIRRYEFSGKKLVGPFDIIKNPSKEVENTSKYRHVFSKPNINEEVMNELTKQVEILSKIERSEEQVLSKDVKIEQILSQNSNLLPLKIRGTALKEGVWNGLFYPASEIQKVATSLEGKPLMTDHSKSVRDIAGKITLSKYNPDTKAIDFEADVTDEKLAKLILEGMVNGVSVGVIVDRVPEGNTKVARNYEFKELSIVMSPACTECVIIEAIPPTSTNPNIVPTVPINYTN